MQKYINQIIRILNQAEQNAPPMEIFSDSEYDFIIKMQILEADARVPLEDILGLTYEEFPPAYRMSEEQTQAVLNALIDALEANGTIPYFPNSDNGIPAKLAYTELLKYLKDGLMESRGWGINFCDRWCPKCAFAKYCSDVWRNWDFLNESLWKSHI